MTFPRNEAFIADTSDKKLSDAEIRRRFKAGEYGAINPAYAKGWWKMSGRAA